MSGHTSNPPFIVFVEIPCGLKILHAMCCVQCVERYVEDEYMAKLLSQKGGSKMKAVYVDTKRQLDMVRRAGAGGFCREVWGDFTRFNC